MQIYCNLLLLVLFVGSVYLFVWANPVNYFGHFTIHMVKLEYIGKTTQSVKHQFQESWESGKLIQ